MARERGLVLGFTRMEGGEDFSLQKYRRLEAAVLVVVMRLQVRRVARLFERSERTINRWINDVKGWDDPLGEAIRRLSGG